MANTSNDKDFEAHQATYSGFLNMVKWSLVGLVVVLLALYFLVQP